jgi:siderophore synthetase component
MQINKKDWLRENRRLMAKMIREFDYEGLLENLLEEDHEGQYKIQCSTQNQEITYTFKGKRRTWGELSIDDDTIKRFPSSFLDDSLFQLFLDLKDSLSTLPSSFTTTYFLEELLRTYQSDLLYRSRVQQTSVQEWINASYATSEMLGPGHPWLVVSKGRMGFSYKDDHAWTPESLSSTKMVMIAVHKKWASYQSVIHRDPQSLYQHELSSSFLLKTQQLWENLQLSSEDFYYMPVHPWQIDHIVYPHFYPLMAAQELFVLGEYEDDYYPQQAIRTLSNKSHPEKYYLKCSLNIFNTAVFRGIPEKRALLAADLSQWLKMLVQKDSFLSDELNPVLLAEVAGITVKHPYFSQLSQTPYQYQESLALIWRESLDSYLLPGEKAYSLSALLLVDSDEKSLIGQMIQDSHLSAEEWIKKFHEVILWPLCHFLYAHGVAFNAHAQNLILITKKGIPHRLCLKDFADDLNIDELYLKDDPHFPSQCRGIILEQPPEILVHFIFSSLFMCFYRYLVPVLEKSSLHPSMEQVFWNQARLAILHYEKNHPHLRPRFQVMSLLEEKMIKVCLNRVRLYTHGYQHDDKRPEPAVHGMVNNPLFIYH